MSNEMFSNFVEVGNLRVYKTAPKDDVKAQGGMLLLPWVTGVGKQARIFAETITEQTGAITMTWDPWHGISSDDTERAELSRRVYELNDAAVLDEQEQILSHMRSELDLKNIGVAGWCLGGRFAFILGGRHADLANVITFHPTVTIPPAENHDIDALAEMEKIKAPAYLAYPGKDSIVSHESFHRMQEVLQAREHAPSIIQLYPDAKHAFSDPIRHNEEANLIAYQQSWPQAIAFMKSTLQN